MLAERAESPGLGGYPGAADRELAEPEPGESEPTDGAVDEDVSAAVDGVLHTESRAPGSLDE